MRPLKSGTVSFIFVFPRKQRSACHRVGKLQLKQLWSQVWGGSVVLVHSVVMDGSFSGKKLSSFNLHVVCEKIVGIQRE